MHWKYKEVLHIHGDVKVVKKNKQKKKEYPSPVLDDDILEPSAIPIWQDSSPVSEKEKQETWMFKSWFVVTAKIHKTFLKHKFRL